MLPSDTSDISLAERFSDFFASKIESIKDILKNSSNTDISIPISDSCNSSFSEFSPVSEDSVRDIIMKSSSTSCSLDPIPTWLLKKCLDELLPVITRIINMSFQGGRFPDILKSAQITPLLKKPNLDCEILKNYRPVSNLKFLAKTIERSCASQIHDYLSLNNLYGKTQSAYRSCHSIETALLRVYNDLLLAVDQGNEAVLILLDYSAAFDTISHTVFLDRLFHRYGVNGTTLNWFKTYFMNRK